MTKRKSHDAVTVEIAASPAQVYALVSDITRMGEWSPECVQCTWTKGATGPAVGREVQGQEQGRARPGLGQHADRDGGRPRSRVRLQPHAAPASATTPGAT